MMLFNCHFDAPVTTSTQLFGLVSNQMKRRNHLLLYSYMYINTNPHNSVILYCSVGDSVNRKENYKSSTFSAIILKVFVQSRTYFCIHIYMY